MPEGSNALGNQIDRQGQLRVVLLEHQVERLEHRAGDVPVEVVGLQVQRVAVGQKFGELVGELLPIPLGDANVYVHFCDSVLK